MSGRSSLFDLRFSQILRHKECPLSCFLSVMYQISKSYDLIIAALSNFNTSLKGAAKCSGMIFVTIGTQHHSKTAI